MTCEVRSTMPPNINYDWYKNNKRIRTGQSYIIGYASTGDSGSYQCKGPNTVMSDPVRLEVSHGWVILQAPLYVHEGDDVTLRCHHYPGYSGRQTLIFKTNSNKRNWGSESDLQYKNITVEGSGRYLCTKEVYNFGYKKHSGEASLSVKELFTTPEIKVTPFPVTEGDNVTVTCHTNMSPYRPETGLLFAFYKDGQNVRSFGSSDRYGFQFSQLQNSGNYYCEVRTVSDRPIVKRSNERIIERLESFSQPEIRMIPNQTTEGDNMTLTCNTTRGHLFSNTTLEFSFYRDGQNVQKFNVSDQYRVEYVQTNHSGHYSCKVRTSTRNLSKSSKEVYIQIQELFTQPQIKMITDVAIEDNQIILTCNTNVTRNGTELQFAFYKEKQNIQEFNSTHRYKVVSAQMRDSGSYFCEVRSSTNVMKRSEELYVDIPGTDDTSLLIVLPLALGMLLLLVVILVTLFICRKGRSSVKTQARTERPTESNDCDGQPEITYAVLKMQPMSQIVPEYTSENHENNIVYSTVKPRSKKRQPAADLDSIYQNMSS